MKRSKAIKARYDAIMPGIDSIYEEIRNSDFLRGITGKWSGANFDFLWCKSDGAQRILEGQYRNS